jgi:D-arabinose 1-dehydrogenase-like Zn-dependent alcohol dehydrogenase
MGSDTEFEAMMKLINGTHLQPVVDSEGLVPFHNIELAFERMEKNSQFGKIVIDISSSSGSLPSKL